MDHTTKKINNEYNNNRTEDNVFRKKNVHVKTSYSNVKF